MPSEVTQLLETVPLPPMHVDAGHITERVRRRRRQRVAVGVAVAVVAALGAGGAAAVSLHRERIAVADDGRPVATDVEMQGVRFHFRVAASGSVEVSAQTADTEGLQPQGVVRLGTRNQAWISPPDLPGVVVGVAKSMPGTWQDIVQPSLTLPMLGNTGTAMTGDLRPFVRSFEQPNESKNFMGLVYETGTGDLVGPGGPLAYASFRSVLTETNSKVWLDSKAQLFGYTQEGQVWRWQPAAGAGPVALRDLVRTPSGPTTGMPHHARVVAILPAGATGVSVSLPPGSALAGHPQTAKLGPDHVAVFAEYAAERPAQGPVTVDWTDAEGRVQKTSMP